MTNSNSDRKNKELLEHHGILLVKKDAEILKKIESGIDTYIWPVIRRTTDRGFKTVNQRVEYLDIRPYKEIPELFDLICQLDALKILKIDSRDRKRLPESIEQLTNLRKLVVRARLESLPQSIGMLTSLKSLDLEFNSLQSLPETIGNLQSLQSLNLRYNNLTNLPGSFTNLKNLRNLDLAHNNLKHLTPDFGNLAALEKLDLDKNNFEDLPESFGMLKNLTELKIWKNNLKVLPQSFGGLSSLKNLNLAGNSLTVLPDLFVHLVSLEELSLHDNRISELPKDFGKLVNLKKLDLRSNKLKFLPSSLWNLKNLKALRLSDNYLLELPAAISGLDKLEHLAIEDNYAIELPLTLEDLFYQNPEFRASLPKKARVIPPKLLFSRVKALRKDINTCFHNSLDQLENLSDYLSEWLAGNENIYPYLLKLGNRLRQYRYKIRDSRSKELLKDLFEQIEAQEQKSKIRIQFISFIEFSGSKSYPMGVLYLSTFLKHKNFTNIKYIDRYSLLRKLANQQRGVRYVSEEEFAAHLPNEEIPPYYLEEDPFVGFYPTEKEKQRFEALLFEELSERNPHVIFLGPINTPDLVELVEFVPKLRYRFPEVLIIAGGPHFGKNEVLDRELITEYSPELDGVIVGEAEETVCEIVEMFYKLRERENLTPSRSKVLEHIQNIRGVLLKKSKLIQRDQLYLESFLFPDFELLAEYWEKERYLWYPYSLSERRNPKIEFVDGVVEGDGDWGYWSDYVRYFDVYLGDRFSPFLFGVIVGSRGCPYRCSFCSPGKRKLHTPKYLFDQMVDLYNRFDYRLFVFFDPLFTSAAENEQKRIAEFCDLLLDSRYNFKYLIEIRADVIIHLHEDLLVNMIKSGCAQFNLGLEKGTDDALAKIMKGITIEDHYVAINKIRQASEKAGRDVLINGTFILGGPGETKKDVYHTFLHAFSLDLDGFIFFPLEIHPGTQIYEEAIKNHIIEPKLASYLDEMQYPLYATSKLSSDYLQRMAKIGRNAVKALNELKISIFGLEKRIQCKLESQEQAHFNERDYELGGLNQEIRNFIVETMDYLRCHPNQKIRDGRKITEKLRPLYEKVNKTIERAEIRFVGSIEDYDSHTGDYHLDTISSKWNYFIKVLDYLFSKLSS